MDIVNEVVEFLSRHGLSTIILLAVADFLLGISAAVKTNTFKWYYVGDILRKTGPMLMALFVVKFLMPEQDEVAAGLAAVIGADLLGASLKNLVIIVPIMDEKFPFTIQPPSAYIASIRNRSPN